jgi:hypothetical protein
MIDGHNTDQPPTPDDHQAGAHYRTPKQTAEDILNNVPAIELMDDIRPLAVAYLKLLAKFKRDANTTEVIGAGGSAF